MCHTARRNFNPLAPCGARPSVELSVLLLHSDFNPLAPCGARPNTISGNQLLVTDFNPLAPCGARRFASTFCPAAFMISIHSPRAGRDLTWFALTNIPVLFQSTRPVRGETPDPRRSPHTETHFNPLAPCGARLTRAHRCLVREPISIHSPRAGRDITLQLSTAFATLFQSTRPVRGETRSPWNTSGPHGNFNPLAPCGARPRISRTFSIMLLFQSTRPVRGETAGG